MTKYNKGITINVGGVAGAKPRWRGW